MKVYQVVEIILFSKASVSRGSNNVPHCERLGCPESRVHSLLFFLSVCDMRTYAYTHSVSVHVCVCVCMCVCAGMYNCECVCVRVCVYVQVHLADTIPMSGFAWTGF